MNAVERYRKRRALRLSVRFDDEIWRTTDNGKHYALETETGEITKGNIGQNGSSKTFKTKAMSGRMSESDRYGRAGKIENARLMYENFKDTGGEKTVKTLNTRLKRMFNKQMREIPEGSRVQIEDKGKYGVDNNLYVFEKRGDKFNGQLIAKSDRDNKEYKDISLGELYNIYRGTREKNPRLSIMNSGSTKETRGQTEQEAKKNGMQTKTENGNMFVEFSSNNLFRSPVWNKKIWAKVVDDPVGSFRGKVGQFDIYSVDGSSVGDDMFGYEIALTKIKNRK